MTHRHDTAELNTRKPLETLQAFELFAEELPTQVDFLHLSTVATISCTAPSCIGCAFTAATLSTVLPS